MAVFEVAIGPGGGPGMFRVEVIDSPAGHPRATARLDAGALAAMRRALQTEVLASSALARGVPESEQLLRSTGQALFAGLLGADGIVGCYRASAAVAAERGEDLRVVLRIDDPALAGLPWEAMFDHEAGAYVCRRDQLVRHVPVASAPAPLQARLPLRILGVVSSPSDLDRLNAGAEKQNLERALAAPASQGLAEVHWVPDATWAGLQDLLMDGEWHVLHYIGHGSFDPARDEGVLALERPDGRADLVSAGRLVDLLRQARPMPRLVVLNSCAGAATGGDLFSGTAAALVRGGVPAVAAMQYKITDAAAIAFARGFYAAIARGRGVDDAATSGRVAIIGTSERTLEWVTPVLYLRSHQARLFTPLPAATAPAAIPAAAPSPGRARALRLLNDAELAARAITRQPDKTWALVQVAEAQAVTDPGRAARLIDEAEHAAQAITDEWAKELALATVSAALTAVNPDRAERIAQAITDEYMKETAMAGAVETLAATDPDRAERIAQAITDVYAKVRALWRVAESVAVTDPDRAVRLIDDAERAAQAISREHDKATALVVVARALAATDPGRAERIPQAITDESTKAWLQAEVAQALAGPDPDRAERAALAITSDFQRTRALAGVAKRLAAADPGRAARLIIDAERAAQAITSVSDKERALQDVVGAVAATDPDRAERIAQAITDKDTKAKALADVTRAVAATDPDRAERIAQAITDKDTKAKALAEVAVALAATDPDRAERIAQAIASEMTKVKVLVKMAEAWNLS